MPEWLTVAAIARRYSLASSTVRTLIRQGRLRAIDVPARFGSKTVFRIQDPGWGAGEAKAAGRLAIPERFEDVAFAYTTAEAARILDISDRQVRNLAESGQLLHFMVGGHRRYSVEQLMACVRQRASRENNGKASRARQAWVRYALEKKARLLRDLESGDAPSESGFESLVSKVEMLPKAERRAAIKRLLEHYGKKAKR